MPHRVLDQDTKSLSSQTHFSDKVGQSQPEHTDSPFKLLLVCTSEFCVHFMSNIYLVNVCSQKCIFTLRFIQVYFFSYLV